MRRPYTLPTALLICGLILAAIAIVGLATSRSRRTSTVTVTQTAPPVVTPKVGAAAPPAQQSPSCGAAVQKEVEEGKGRLGVCAPTPPKTVGGALASPAGSTGPDTSNNNPIYSWGAVKSHGHPFAWTKLIQGTSFVDQTAARQVQGMRKANVQAGGYDFLEVCVSAAATQARAFYARLKATGTAKALVPVGDAEWPLSAPCSASAARAWLTAWSNTVHSLTGRWPAFYTGAWWWDPNVGCWWPPHALAWISGYGVGYPSLPCGLTHLDWWQYTDAGYNGVSYSDMSVLRHPLSAFLPPKVTPRPTEAELRKLLGAYSKRNPHGHNCAHPPYRHAYPSAAYDRACLTWAKQLAALKR